MEETICNTGIKLESCPFCGRNEVYLDFSNYSNHPYFTSDDKYESTLFLYLVECGYCHCRTADYKNPQDAIEAWNCRTK